MAEDLDNMPKDVDKEIVKQTVGIMDNNPKDWYLEIPGRATAITNAISNDQTTVQHNVWQCKITLNMTQLYKIIGIEISEATANYNQIQRVCEANKDEEGWTPDNIR
eukprot:358072_1